MKNKKTRGPKGRRGAKGTVKDQCEYTSKIDYPIGMNIHFHYIVKKTFHIQESWLPPQISKPGLFSSKLQLFSLFKKCISVQLKILSH